MSSAVCRVPFIAAIVVARLVALPVVPARADVWYDMAALQCDPAQNLAIVRVGGRYDDLPPEFGALPQSYRAQFATVDPQKHECRLSNGRTVTLKLGVGQAFAYGEGGAGPPAWISLWLDGRVLLSHFEVKTGYADHVSRPVTSLIYTPGRLRICDKVSDWAQYEKPAPQPKRDADGCFTRRVEEGRLQRDAVAVANRKATLGRLTVAAVYSPAFCRRFIFPKETRYNGAWVRSVLYDGPEAIAYLPLVKKDLAINSFDEAHEWRGEEDAEVPAHLRWDYFDFDNDGFVDTVIKGWDDRGYMDGELYLVKRGQFPEAVKSLGTAKDYRDWAKANGFSIYSGDQTVYHIDRYTHLAVFRLDGTTYLLASPGNYAMRPSALLYKPLPDGKLDELCIYQQVETKY